MVNRRSGGTLQSVAYAPWSVEREQGMVGNTHNALDVSRISCPRRRFRVSHRLGMFHSWLDHCLRIMFTLPCVLFCYRNNTANLSQSLLLATSDTTSATQ